LPILSWPRSWCRNPIRRSSGCGKKARFVLAFGRQAFKVDGNYHFWGGLVVESVGAGKGLSDQLK
jgi:hypothetical protein